MIVRRVAKRACSPTFLNDFNDSNDPISHTFESRKMAHGAPWGALGTPVGATGVPLDPPWGFDLQPFYLMVAVSRSLHSVEHSFLPCVLNFHFVSPFLCFLSIFCAREPHSPRYYHNH